MERMRGSDSFTESMSAVLKLDDFVPMDGTVWDHSTFSKNRERLLEHDVLVLLFNETVEMARERGHLSCEHFSGDGTLIRAWAGHKSFVPEPTGPTLRGISIAVRDAPSIVSHASG